MASRNEYAAEHRDETADYIISTGRPIAEVCREPGINPKTGGRWVKERRGRPSVGRTGSCRDNAVAESFFASPKNEMHHRSSFATRAEARLAVVGCVERFYSRQGPHSSIGYRVPGLVMDAFMERMSELLSPPAKPMPKLPLAA